MKIKTAELSGPAIRWAVAKCEQRLTLTGLECMSRVWFTGRQSWHHNDDGEQVAYEPDTNWAQGGPIIEREGMHIDCLRMADHYRTAIWEAWPYATGTKHISQGPTPLLAAMRCYVASKLGDGIDLPDSFA